uniref:Riboflavin kinase n=2 Tax=Phasianidae TaxID=9005 RepID=A0A8C9FI44_PAVCR
MVLRRTVIHLSEFMCFCVNAATRSIAILLRQPQTCGFPTEKANAKSRAEGKARLPPGRTGKDAGRGRKAAVRRPAPPPGARFRAAASANSPSRLPARGADSLRRTAGEPRPTAAGGEGRSRRRGRGRAHRRGEAEACRCVLPLGVRRCPPPRGGARGEAGAAAAAGSGGVRPGFARLGAAGSAGRSVAAMRHLPYFCRGEVVKGFGRGSKELGVPTANFSEQVVESFPSDISTGIYYGWACVGSGDVHKMVLSIGWNPFYKNTKKSVETHIIHTFKEDFYGEILSIAIIGYIRPEKNFDSLDALIAAIQEDIEEAKRQLDLPEHLKLKEDNFFHLPGGKIVDNH